MIWKKLAGALLMIAIGLLACCLGRADDFLAAAVGSSFALPDGTLPGMYSARLASSERGEQNVFEIRSGGYGRIAVGTIAVTAAPADDPCAPTLASSGAPETSFSNLNLPPTGCWQLDPERARQTGWMPGTEDQRSDIWAVSFADWNSQRGACWELVSDRIGAAVYRELAPAISKDFEISGDWRTTL